MVIDISRHIVDLVPCLHISLSLSQCEFFIARFFNKNLEYQFIYIHILLMFYLGPMCLNVVFGFLQWREHFLASVQSCSRYFPMYEQYTFKAYIWWIETKGGDTLTRRAILTNHWFEALLIASAFWYHVHWSNGGAKTSLF